MNNENLHLREMRETAGKTIEDVADSLGVSKATVSNWEREPKSMSIDKLNAYVKACGYQLQDAFTFKNRMKNQWNIPVNGELSALRDGLVADVQVLGAKQPNFIKQAVLVNKNAYDMISGEFKTRLAFTRKPRVAIIGQSDVGKSTLINDMLGSNTMPARWTPTTTLVVRIVHSEEKPAWLKGNTIVVKTSLAEALPETYQLRDKEYFNSHVEEKGDQSLLASWAIRESVQDEAEVVAAKTHIDPAQDKGSRYTMYTYQDAPILKSIEIWDTPGFAADGEAELGQAEDAQALYAQSNADVFVFMSIANGFMHDADLSLLRPIVTRMDRTKDYQDDLPAWHNLFVVASQAQAVKPADQLPVILNNGAVRFASTIKDRWMDKNGQYTLRELQSRFFTFSIDDTSLSNKFIEALTQTIVIAQKQTLNKETAGVIKSFRFARENVINKYIGSYQQALDTRTIAEKRYQQALENQPKTEAAIRKSMGEMRNDVDHHAHNSKLEYNQYLNQTLTVENFCALMKKWDTKNKKDSKREAINHLMNTIQDELNDQLRKHSEKFAKEFHAHLDDAKINSDISEHVFDIQAIASGLVAAGMVGGAFAVVAAGITSNLGLYLVAGSVGGVLTSAGIISSPTVLVSLVSVLGGPVAWVVGLSLIAATITGSLVHSAGWRTKFAKAVIGKLNSVEMCNQFNDSIDTYWQETRDEINKLESKMIAELDERVKVLSVIGGAKESDLKTGIKQLQGLCLTLDELEQTNH